MNADINNYSFEDIYIGMKESFSVVITSEMVDKFCDITGDINPLHRNEEFAKSKGFSGTVVYGMLTSSFLSTLAGCYLPGERSLIREVDVKLKKPVFIGDRLTITGEVTDLRAEFQIFDMKVTITNQENEKVLRGMMQMGVI